MIKNKVLLSFLSREHVELSVFEVIYKPSLVAVRSSRKSSGVMLFLPLSSICAQLKLKEQFIKFGIWMMTFTKNMLSPVYTPT